MKIANYDGASLIVTSEDEGIDVFEASGGRFGPSVEQLYADWAEFVSWGTTADLTSLPRVTIDRGLLGAPSPRPSQVFAVGLNYSEHAAESGFDLPTEPPIFTKFASCITGPDTVVTLPQGGHNDWETELVIVVGKPARNVAENDAWEYIAGLTVGQDLSERILQMVLPAKQFSLGKSYPGFGPTGPWLVTPDEFDHVNDLALGCTLDGVSMQSSRTKHLIFSVAELVSYLSNILALAPGDIIFTGTPDGVGLGRTPQVWLQPGQTLISTIEGIGSLTQTFD